MGSLVRNDNSKTKFYTELAYVVGLLALAAGAALMQRADFGMSMVVAPAYLIHLKVSQFLPFFSFGMAEYTLQLVIILALALVLRRFRLSYLFSLVTAVLYGFALDGFIALMGLIPDGGFAARVIFFVVGELMVAVGVALMFHTYISPEAYELFVKELSDAHSIDIGRCKTVYDCVSCAVSIVLSFCFFGLWHFEGIGVGTVICALCNGWLIGQCSALLERRFDFCDRLALRRYFE